MNAPMNTPRTNTTKSANSMTPRIKAGKTLFKSAQGDLNAAQRKLDSARAIRRSARGSAA